MKMHRYVKQLLEDLETAAANPPAPPCIEFLNDFEVDLWITELALAPFKPISEWVGIKTEVFPPVQLLTAIQMEKLFDAMVQLLDSLNIQFFLPENFPRKRKYGSLVSEWDTPVQYLPQSGFDLFLCEGDREICPHRRYCTCPEEDDFFMDQDRPRERSSNEEDIECPF